MRLKRVDITAIGVRSCARVQARVRGVCCECARRNDVAQGARSGRDDQVDARDRVRTQVCDLPSTTWVDARVCGSPGRLGSNKGGV